MLVRRRRTSGAITRANGTITQANKKMPARSNPPTSNVCGVSPMTGRDHSRTRVGASTVAGVAATIAGALAGAADGSTEGSDGAAAGRSPWLTGAADAAMEAEGDAAATWVSTVGENAAAGAAAASSGFAGASFEATTGGCVTAAGDSAARELVASIPAITGLAAGEEEEGEDSVFASLARLFAAATALGIGLGSIAGLDSVGADMAAAASVVGVEEATIAGPCSQPRS